MRKRIIGAFCMTALASGAAEPVWPADFAEKVAANIAAAQPGAGQISASNVEPVSSVRKWYSSLSEFVSLNTKKLLGFVVSFR